MLFLIHAAFVSSTSSRATGEAEGDVLALPALTSENEPKCSGRETRTHNLAGDRDEDPEQHQLE